MYILQNIVQRSDWVSYYQHTESKVRKSILPQGATRTHHTKLSLPLYRPRKFPCLVNFTLQHTKTRTGIYSEQIVFMHCDRTSAKRLVYPTTNKFTERSLDKLNRYRHLYPPRPYFLRENLAPLLEDIIKRCMIGCHQSKFDSNAQQFEIDNTIAFIKTDPVLIGGVSILRLDGNDLKCHVVFYIVPEVKARRLVYHKKSIMQTLFGVHGDKIGKNPNSSVNLDPTAIRYIRHAEPHRENTEVGISNACRDAKVSIDAISRVMNRASRNDIAAVSSFAESVAWDDFEEDGNDNHD